MCFIEDGFLSNMLLWQYHQHFPSWCVRLGEGQTCYYDFWVDAFGPTLFSIHGNMLCKPSINGLNELKGHRTCLIFRLEQLWI